MAWARSTPTVIARFCAAAVIVGMSNNCPVKKFTPPIRTTAISWLSNKSSNNLGLHCQFAFARPRQYQRILSDSIHDEQSVF